MNFTKIFSKLMIVLGILALILVAYITLAPKMDKGNPGKVANAPDFSVSVGTSAKKSARPTSPQLKNVIKYELYDGNTTKTYYRDASKTYTVFSFLQELSNSPTDKVEMKYNNKYSFGILIESIDNLKNGTDGKYWQYYINGKLGEVAADKQELKANDVLVWKFEKVP